MNAAGRAAARLDQTLRAYKCGYSLVDTIETNAAGTGYLAAELLVCRIGADAVVTHGPGSRRMAALRRRPPTPDDPQAGR